MEESPIFIKTYEMMVWLLQHTGKFPRQQRFLMAKRLEDSALDLHACLNAAAPRRGRAAVGVLRDADLFLANLKVYNRLSKDLKLLSFAQYEHLAGMLDELGRLLGGWLRSESNRSSAGDEPASR